MENNTTAESEFESIRDVKLDAKISVAEGAININYSVTNESGNDIYVLDAYPAIKPDDSTAAYANLKEFYLCFRSPGTALVLKGIPPAPSMPVTVRIMPLGTKLGSKEKLDREFVLPLPLRERSDWYYPPLPPEEYELGSIDRILFTVQFLRSTIAGFNAAPAHYAPEFFIVNGEATVIQAESLSREFKIDKSQLFRRKDRFTRL